MINVPPRKLRVEIYALPRRKVSADFLHWSPTSGREISLRTHRLDHQHPQAARSTANCLLALLRPRTGCKLFMYEVLKLT